MLSSIRFSCSLAAAEGPWEETTDEAEKKELRILLFSSSLMSLDLILDSLEAMAGVSRVSRIVFLHSCTQIILARGDLICKDEADDVLMFLSYALKYRIDFSKWNPP